MNAKIYKTPEANLVKLGEYTQADRVLVGPFDKPMLLAVVVQIVLIAVLSVLSLINKTAMSLENVSIGFVSETFWAVFLVYLIRKIRGNKKISRKYPSVYETLSTWDYLWRSLLSKYISLFLTIIFLALLSVATRLESPSIGFTVLSLGLSLVISVVATWLLFSTDRAGQFKWVLTIFRGY
jgi:hypothetical protein